jgi:hypothetical protein
MRLPVAGLILFLAAASDARGQDAKAILGIWRGTSVCVNREVAPACRDEAVIYDFRERTPAAAGKLTLNADKIEDGKAVPMGVLDLAWDSKEGAWTYEIQNARAHALWIFKQPAGDDLSGTLVTLPERTLIRKAAARRSKKGAVEAPADDDTPGAAERIRRIEKGLVPASVVQGQPPPEFSLD